MHRPHASGCPLEFLGVPLNASECLRMPDERPFVSGRSPRRSSRRQVRWGRVRRASPGSARATAGAAAAASTLCTMTTRSSTSTERLKRRRVERIDGAVRGDALGALGRRTLMRLADVLALGLVRCSTGRSLRRHRAGSGAAEGAPCVQLGVPCVALVRLPGARQSRSVQI